MSIPHIPHGATPILASGVDWLTATCCEPLQRRAFRDIGEQLVAEQANRGNDKRPFNAHGYRGVMSGHALVATRDTDTMIRVSSDLAASTWRVVHQLATNVSRLDVQVTTKRAESDVSVALQASVDAGAFGARQHRGMTVGYATDNQGKAICTIGSRASNRFARLYDKGIESGEGAAGLLWRWEVEYKNECATLAANLLAATAIPEREASRLVWQHFAERGVVPDWHTGADPIRLVIPASLTDDEKRLGWLARSVRPCVQGLLARYGREVILSVLDLTN